MLSQQCCKLQLRALVGSFSLIKFNIFAGWINSYLKFGNHSILDWWVRSRGGRERGQFWSAPSSSGSVYNRYPRRGVPSSIFSATNKTCKVMVVGWTFFMQVLPFPSSNALITQFLSRKWRKMVFTRFGGQVRLNGGQVRQFWGRGLMSPILV